MEFASQVVSYMVNLICEKISNNNDLTQDEIEKIYFNINGKKIDQLEFLKKYFYLVDYNMLYELWNILVSYQTIYDEKIDFFCETCKEDYQYVWDFALPLLSTYKILNDYTTPKRDKTLRYYSNTSLKKFKKDFLNKEKLGISVLRGFLRIICDNELFTNNEKAIEKNYDDYSVLNKWRNKKYIRVTTINDIMRTTYYNLYSYYLNQGNEKYTIASYIWAFFKNNFDPLKTLEKYGFNEEDILTCKHLMIKTMLADLYEDSLNNEYNREWFTLTDFGDTVDNDKIFSMTKSNYDSAFYLKTAQSNNYYEQIINNKFLAEVLFYNYSEVLDNPDRMAANRKNTFKEGRQLELAKINPNYKLDEF